jgi:hypothetical protein
MDPPTIAMDNPSFTPALVTRRSPRPTESRAVSEVASCTWVSVGWLGEPVGVGESSPEPVRGWDFVDGQTCGRGRFQPFGGIERMTIQQPVFALLQLLNGGGRAVEYPALFRRPALEGRLPGGKELADPPLSL